MLVYPNRVYMCSLRCHAITGSNRTIGQSNVSLAGALARTMRCPVGVLHKSSQENEFEEEAFEFFEERD